MHRGGGSLFAFGAVTTMLGFNWPPRFLRLTCRAGEGIDSKAGSDLHASRFHLTGRPLLGDLRAATPAVIAHASADNPR